MRSENSFFCYVFGHFDNLSRRMRGFGPSQTRTTVTINPIERKTAWPKKKINVLVTSCCYQLFHNTAGSLHEPQWNRSLSCHLASPPRVSHGWASKRWHMKSPNAEINREAQPLSPLSFFFDTHAQTQDLSQQITSSYRMGGTKSHLEV